MAEFREAMENWKRMCSEMDKMNGCEDCPVIKSTHGARCGESPMDVERIEEIEQVVMRWATEHPEPVYPTWWKYMCMIGVIPEELGDKTLEEMTVYSLMNTRIQSDIAEKLGIEPKEG